MPRRTDDTVLPPSAGADVARQLRLESNLALERGASVMFAVASAATVLTSGALLGGLMPPLWHVPIFALVCAAAMLALWRLARARRLDGWRAWLAALGLASLPTVELFVSGAFHPMEAAIDLQSPIPLIYFLFVSVTGLLFRFRLAVAAGIVAALGYGAAALAFVPAIHALDLPDHRLADDLTQPSIYVFKAFLIGSQGLAVGALAVVAKRLAMRVLDEARSKASIHRLLGEYVSEEVREKLLHDPPPASGDLKEVAVLFSDIRGFTTLSETADPRLLVSRLNDYFDAMVRPIRVEGGVVDKFVGDAIMAVFGSVLRLEDPCAAAVRAARRMSARLGELNERWARDGVDPPFEAGIGVHFGPAVVGSIGSVDRKDFTVIGDAVNTASRVEGLTKDHPYAILITHEVFDRLPAELRSECVALGQLSVKGRAAPIEVYGVRASEPGP